MKTILFIIQKELIQVFRNKTMVPIIFLMPILQLIILVNAATLEMKRITVFVADNDLSDMSRELTGKFEGSPFFIITGNSFSVKEAEKALFRDEADMVLVIPAGFEKKIMRGERSVIQVQINAINGMVAGLINAYSGQIISGYNAKISMETASGPDMQMPPSISLSNSFWYNPGLNYRIYMVPGILMILITVVGMFLSAINIVREKEMGTIEQINVTPIRKYQFIIGKMIPFWLIAMIELAFGLTVGKLLFDVPIEGSLFVLFAMAALFLIVTLGFGLLLSTLANTQQQVMFFAFFFLMLFIMMSGLFTPTESMPYWAQQANIINPIAVFLKSVRMILLKGSGFSDLLPQVYYLSVYAFAIMALAVFRYRKTSA